MCPSLSGIFAISTFRRDSGISTRGCRDWVALRIRASMSAIGSVIFLNLVVLSAEALGWCLGPIPRPFGSCPAALPATLGHACDVPLQRELAEAEAAQRALAQGGARPGAAAAAVAQPDLELRRLRFLGDLRGRGHEFVFSRYRVYDALNGIPRSCSSLRDSSSVFAVVTTEMFIPRALSTFM